jgi:hypothetical protein
MQASEDSPMLSEKRFSSILGYLPSAIGRRKLATVRQPGRDDKSYPETSNSKVAFLLLVIIIREN